MSTWPSDESAAAALLHEVFAREYRGLHRMAASIVGDHSGAEDAVQDAVVVALRKPPRDASKLTGWMYTVVRRFAVMQRRRQALHASKVAKIAHDSEVESVDTVVARSEILALVADLVDELPAASQDLLMRRYVDGVGLAQIARDRGVPAGTIRAQHKRLLDLLHGRIVARTGRSPLQLAVLLVGISDAPRSAARGASGRRSSWRMPAAAALVAALGVGSLTALVTHERVPQSSASSPTAIAIADVDRGARGERIRPPGTETTPGVDAPTERVPSATQPAPSEDEWSLSRSSLELRGELPRSWKEVVDASGVPWSLSVRVVDAAGANVRSEEVSFAPEGKQFERALDFGSDLVDPCELVIRAEHPDVLPLEWTQPLAIGASRSIEMDLPGALRPAAFVEGRVVDEVGSPLAGVDVFAESAHSSPVRADVAVSDSDGAYRLRVEPGEDVLLFAEGTSGGVGFAPVAVGAPRSTVARRLVIPRSGDLRVTLDGPPGFPWHHVRLSLRTSSSPAGSEYVRGPHGGLWCDEAGAWRTNRHAELSGARSVQFPGGLAQDATVTLSGVDLAPGLVEPLQLSADRHDVDRRLRVEAVAVAVHVHADGEPPRGCRVTIPSTEHTPSTLQLDARGHGVLWMAPATAHTLVVEADGCTSREITVQAPDVGVAAPPVDVELERHSHQRQWFLEVDHDGPLDREIVGVRLRAADPVQPGATKLLTAIPTGDGARYVVEGVPPGRFVASLRLGTEWLVGRSRYQDVLLEIDASEGDPSPRSVSFELGGRLLVGARAEDGWLRRRFDLLAPDGESTGARVVGGSATAHSVGATSLQHHGPSLLDRALAPGEYTIVLGYGDDALRVRTHLRAGELTTEVIEVDEN